EERAQEPGGLLRAAGHQGARGAHAPAQAPHLAPGRLAAPGVSRAASSAVGWAAMRLAFLLSLTLLVSAPSPAWALKGAKSAAALVREGERLYNSGKYREAAEALKKAQALQPNHKLIYNIARAYQRSGDLREALSWYQQYVG